MDKYYIAVAGILVTAILILTLRRYNGETAVVLGLCACCMAGALALTFLSPVIDFMKRLQQLGALDGQMLQILLRVTAVAFVGEIAGAVCGDSGNAALGKGVQILTAAVILYLSLPMLDALLALVERILGGL